MSNAMGSSEAEAADRSHKFRQALLGGLVVLAVSLLGYAIYDVVTH